MIRGLPDVLLLDIALPGINGYQVAQQIGGLLKPKPLLIAVTGYGLEGDRQRTLEAGFDHHLVKPVDPLELTKLLKDYAATRVGKRPSSAS